MKISFIGLGVMGFPMAGHLQNAGFDVTVYNRTSEKAKKWAKEYGGSYSESVSGCVEQADVVFSCVGNDNDVRSVTTHPEGAIAAMKKGAILVDHTTTSALLAEELAQACSDAHIRFMDAPVSGGESGAVGGILTIMCGGSVDDFESLQTLFSAYGKSSVLMGSVGQGQRAKMVNQICVAGALAGLSEGLILAEKSGLDISALINCLKNGAAGSWQMENRAENMAQGKFDYGFAIDLMIKDLGFCLDEAERQNIELPLTKTTTQQYCQLSEQGLGKMDTSVLIKAIRKE